MWETNERCGIDVVIYREVNDFSFFIRKNDNHNLYINRDINSKDKECPMNRLDFTEKMRHVSSIIDPNFMDKVIGETHISIPANTNVDGGGNLVIAMEEMAELQQEISKYLRGKGDKVGLTEEIADVILCMEYVRTITGIEPEDISKAMNVKLERMHDRFTNGEWK